MLARMVKSTLFIEQPIKRQWRSAGSVDAAGPICVPSSSTNRTASCRLSRGAEARLCRRLDQELQGLLQVDPECRRASPGSATGYFMSAEDLTTLPGVSVQQDLALVSLLGLAHVERNAHHFIDGMAVASEGEQQAFRRRASDLYDRQGRQAGASQGPRREDHARARSVAGLCRRCRAGLQVR